MARGKYADKAAKRQAELAVETDLASYQHRVAKLTAENRELRERLATQERTAKQTERRLRAERDEGVAPQVEVLRLQLRAAERRHHEQIGRIFDAAATLIRTPGAEFVQSDLIALAESLGRTWAELAGPAVGPRNRRRVSPKVGNANLLAYEAGYAAALSKSSKPA